MAVVFPAPAGAIASCSRAPGGAHLADQCGLPSIQGGAVRRHLQQGQIHRHLVDGCTAASSGGGDETGLGVEDPLRCVEVGTGHGVDRRPVDPPQHLRFVDVVSRCGQGNRPAIEHLIDQQVHQCRGMFSGHVDGAELSLCFGPDMPHLPGRAALLHDGQDVAGCLGDPVGVDDRGGFGRRRQGRPHHRRDGLRAAQHGCGFAEPGGALLSQGSGFVFGVAGLQRRLLRQMQRFDRCRWPAMIMLGTGSASSPRRVSMWARRVDQRWFSRGSTPTISRIGRFAGSVPGRSANRTPNAVAEVLFERGVVGLRRGNVGFEQHPPVDRQPASVEGLHLVRHRDVGVQIRVAGPAVAVGERGRDEAADIDLPDALWPGPGEQGMLLDERSSASLTAA